VGEPQSTVSTQPYEIVAVGGSAGGITALSELLGGLPQEFAVAVVIVQHIGRNSETAVDDIFRRHSALPVKLVEHEEPIEPGVVYVAPPDCHVVVGSNRTLELSRHEDVRFVRPAADPLFKSVAEKYGPSAIACVLTGTGNDGAEGVKAIKARGGTVIVQDPESAEFDGMPKAAVGTSSADFVLPLEEIAAKLRRLVADRTS
jgi:two-component system, chemotaxis family, protein-glutamate methylesterase/glutaminase